MSKMYLQFKDQVRSIINKHFPDEIAKRFTLRMEGEIWIPKEDRGVWGRHRDDTERLSVLFDGYEIFEIHQAMNQAYAELGFLRALKAAVVDGKISFTKVKEWVDPKAAKRARQKKQAVKKIMMKDAYQYARDSGDTVEVATKKILNQSINTIQLKGGK